MVAEGLVRVEKRLANPTSRDAAYASFLRALDAWGYLDDLPLDASGTLRVNAPFSGGFSEAPLLMPFLAAKYLRHAGGACTSVSVLATDLEASNWWPTFREWTRRTQGPCARLDFAPWDLLARPLPPAALTLGVHPGPDLAPWLQGPWQQIIRNVLTSRARGGRCIFASFYEHEVNGIGAVCQEVGARMEVRDNPYYLQDPTRYYEDHLGVKATPLRFITIIDP